MHGVAKQLQNGSRDLAKLWQTELRGNRLKDRLAAVRWGGKDQVRKPIQRGWVPEQM